MSKERDQDILVEAIAEGHKCHPANAWIIAEELFERYLSGEAPEDLLEEYNVSSYLVPNLVNFL